MTLLRVVMMHCCLTRFALVADCRWLDQEWLNLVGWMGSSAQTIPFDQSHHQCTQCVCVFVCILSPGRLMKKVGRDVMDRDFVLFIVLYFFNYLCGPFYYPMRDCVV